MDAYTSPINVAPVMLTHFAAEFGTPASESANRPRPTIAISQRMVLLNLTYSEKLFPNILITSSWVGVLWVAIVSPQPRRSKPYAQLGLARERLSLILISHAVDNS